MLSYYVESSALVKRYAEEEGTAWVRSVMSQKYENRLFVSRISAVEVVSALARRREQGAISKADYGSVLAQFLDDFSNDYIVIEVDRSIVDSAVNIADSHALRAYDAVQLASALSVQRIRDELSLSGLVFVSADDRLNKVAQASRLDVKNPSSKE